MLWDNDKLFEWIVKPALHLLPWEEKLLGIVSSMAILWKNLYTGVMVSPSSAYKSRGPRWSIGGEKEAAGAPSIVQKKSVEAESEKGPEGAFNEETGEINWDCPVRQINLDITRQS